MIVSCPQKSNLSQSSHVEKFFSKGQVHMLLIGLPKNRYSKFRNGRSSVSEITLSLFPRVVNLVNDVNIVSGRSVIELSFKLSLVNFENL